MKSPRVSEFPCINDWLAAARTRATADARMRPASQLPENKARSSLAYRFAGRTCAAHSSICDQGLCMGLRAARSRFGQPQARDSVPDDLTGSTHVQDL